MTFKTEKQRKGFFASLKDKLERRSIEKHEEHKRELQEKLDKEKAGLKRLKAKEERQQEETKLKREIDKIEKKEKRLRTEQFERSSTGKALRSVANVSRTSREGLIKGVKKIAAFEKKNYKKQVKQLNKIFR